MDLPQQAAGEHSLLAISAADVAPPMPRPPRSRPFTGVEPVRLSIVMPAYNEAATIDAAIDSVLAVDYPCAVELIVVDDGSTDATQDILATYSDRVHVLRHPRNLGKGAALLTGMATATGTHLIPFDADLEYDPEDIPALLGPVLSGYTDVVYGTRLFGANTVYQSYRYAMGNRFTTLAANVLFDSYLNDLHTCLKLVPLNVLRACTLRETGFGLDTEITARLLQQGIRPFEVPVRYFARTHAEGKKITWRDGVSCLQILGRVRFRRNARTGPTRPAPHTAPPLRPVTTTLAATAS